MGSLPERCCRAACANNHGRVGASVGAGVGIVYVELPTVGR
jgi:hypothetical protein